MNSTLFFRSKWLYAVLIISATIVLASWGHQQTPGTNQQNNADTIPQKGLPADEAGKKVKDLDDIFDNNEKININWEKIQQELSEALKKIDFDKMKLDVEKALKDVDMGKIQKEVQEAMAKVDFKKIQAEVTAALKEVDMEKIQAEIKEAMEKVDWEEFRKEIEKIKEIDLKDVQKELQKVQAELKELNPKLEQELSKAKVEIEKARETITEYKEFINGLNSDGLINKEKGYSLKHKDGELFINGNKASRETYNKHSDFLSKHKKFSIDTNNDGDFNIDND